jgi:hypothetical protein
MGRVASGAADPESKRRAAMVRREVWTWLAAFAGPALRVLALMAVLGVAVVLASAGLVAPRGMPAPLEAQLWLGVEYGLALGIAPAVWAGASSLAFTLARGWALVPTLGIPACVAGALYLAQGALRARADEVVHALDERLDARGLEMLTDVFAHAPRSLGPMDVPDLMARAGEPFFDPPVRAALGALAIELETALVLGLGVGIVLSVPALVVGYRRGLAARHAGAARDA